MPKNKLLRVIFVLLFLFLFTVTAIQLNFTLLLNKQIKNHLLKEISRQTNGEYQVQISKLYVDVLTRSIVLRGIILESTSEINSSSPKIFYSVEEISFLRFNVLRLLLKRELIIRQIELKNSSGYLYRGKAGKQKPDTEKFSLYHLIRKYLKHLEIIHTNVVDADIRIFNQGERTPFVVSRNNHLRITNLKISQAVEQSGRLFYADSLKLEINNIQYKSKDQLYTTIIKKLTASYTDSQLSFDSVRILPNYNKTEFQARVGHQTDWFRIVASQLIFKQMNVKTFFESNEFISKSLTIYNLDILAYRDKNLQRKNEPAKSVQQLIREIPVFASIDSIRLKNGKITYQEVPEGSKEAGEIFFSEIYATLTGLNSYNPSLFEIRAKGRIMNKSNLSVHYRFPLSADKMVFDCTGELKDFPLSALNQILSNNAQVRVKRGVADSLIFAFHADDKRATGTLKFVYHDLKIELLSKNKKSGIIQDLFTFFTHQFLLKENNPSGNKPTRITRISYPRDPTRFFLNYSWKSILSGIKPAIGIDKI